MIADRTICHRRSTANSRTKGSSPIPKSLIWCGESQSEVRLKADVRINSAIGGDCCLYNQSGEGLLGDQLHRTEPPQLPFKALMRIDALAEAGVADLDCAEDYVVSVI